MEDREGRGEGRGVGGERTGPFGSKVLGSATWSAWSLMGFESRVERNDLAKDSSVMVLRCRGGSWLIGIWVCMRISVVESDDETSECT